jgi:hypothetical protein
MTIAMVASFAVLGSAPEDEFDDLLPVAVHPEVEVEEDVLQPVDEQPHAGIARAGQTGVVEAELGADRVDQCL